MLSPAANCAHAGLHLADVDVERTHQWPTPAPTHLVIQPLPGAAHDRLHELQPLAVLASNYQGLAHAGAPPCASPGSSSRSSISISQGVGIFRLGRPSLPRAVQVGAAKRLFAGEHGPAEGTSATTQTRQLVGCGRWERAHTTCAPTHITSSSRNVMLTWRAHHLSVPGARCVCISAIHWSCRFAGVTSSVVLTGTGSSMFSVSGRHVITFLGGGLAHANLRAQREGPSKGWD